MSKVYVYDDSGDAVAMVEYNNDLDYWNGSDWTCGSVGRHKGITRLKDGRYVLIHGTQWQGEQDTAEIISAEEALQEILKADAAVLLEEPKFSDLKELWEQNLVEEME